MPKIAALSAHVPIRLTPVRAAVAAPAVKVEAPKAEAPKTAQPAPQVQAVAARALSALIDLQAKAEPVVARLEQAAPQATPVVDKAESVVGKVEEALAGLARPADPQPAHGNDDQHAHAPPPVVQPPAPQPPVPLDPQPTHGQDDDHGHKPPVQDPHPVVHPPVIPAAPYDPAAPQRTIAMIAQRLADEAVQDQARAAFAAQRAAERAAVTISEGRAALAIFQAMQQSYDAWRAAPAHGFSQRFSARA